MTLHSHLSARTALALGCVSIAAAMLGTTSCSKAPDEAPVTSKASALQSAAGRTRGPHDPLPIVDLGLGQKALILMLDFASRDVVKFRSAMVGPGRARGRLAEPPLLKFRLIDGNGATLEEFKAWHPMWEFRWQNGAGGRREGKIIRPQATGRFVLPFHATMSRIELYDVPRRQLVFSGGLADLGILSLKLATPPAEMLAGTPANITLEANVSNAGPAGPIDVLLRTAAAGDAGGSVMPAQQETESAALPAGQQRTISQTFSVGCDTPGAHTFTFSVDVRSKNAQDIDVKLADNKAQVTLNVECVVPVAINIKPHGSANPINLNSANVPVAVLTTVAGEYGLPLAVDARLIDPLTARFGPEGLAWGGGGGAEIHARGHLEDSYELDERTRDGDRDMVLHFNPAGSGLTEATTKACVKGTWSQGNSAFKFFGCDNIRIVP